MFVYTNVVGEVGWIDAKPVVTNDAILEKSNTLATVTRRVNRGTWTGNVR